MRKSSTKRKEKLPIKSKLISKGSFAVTDADTGDIFYLHRPIDADSINQTIDEFCIDLKSMVDINAVKKLIEASENPMKNFEQIEQLFPLLNRRLALYFNFATVRDAETNELKKVIPQLFQDGATFFTFLRSVKTIMGGYTVTHGSLGATSTYTSKQIALAIFYRHAAGTFKIPPYETTEIVRAVAKEYHIESAHKLQQHLSSAMGEGGIEFRKSVFTSPRWGKANLQALELLLANDKKATYELKKDVAKLRNPVT